MSDAFYEETLEDWLHDSSKIRKCPICGKIFECYCPSEWVYKIYYKNGRYKQVCSYTCMRKWQKDTNYSKKNYLWR